MGKGKRKFKHNDGRNKKFKGGNNGERKDTRVSYEDIVKENVKFEKYYKLQKICPEEEWGIFMESLRTSLPTTFRITATRSEAKALLHMLEQNLLRDAVLAGKSDMEMALKPVALPWYPSNFAWQLNLTRKDIRRNESYFRLHHFLISETESGNISRQEAVSMIPPLVLKAEPHHKILDMCAAPGSKTAQLIETLQESDQKDSEGLLIANDMDNRRCYMLVHQAKRLQSPSFLITNHDASLFPDISFAQPDGSLEKLKFDRILCDVPCSGDGTIRKNIDVWRKWSTSNAFVLHSTQCDILKRGLELLKVNGLLVYSTCSLNPVENEAVVHRILVESKGSVKLVDIDMPHLKHMPGMSKWIPCTPDLDECPTLEDVPEKWKTVVSASVFPPAEADAPEFHLEKCMRILAHQQDTGNFFIALFTKTSDVPWKTVLKGTKGSKNGDGDSAQSESKPTLFRRDKKRKMLQGYKEDPYIFLTDDDPIWEPIRQFYSLDENLRPTNFLTRSAEGKKRNVYFVTDFIKNVVISNESVLKIINTGVKTFARCGQNNKWTAADFRLAQEGLKAILPYLHGRRVTLTSDGLVQLLINEDETKPPLLTTLSRPTQDQLEPMEKGSCVLAINGAVDGGPEFCLHLVGWRGATSLRAYVPKTERMHFLRLCGGDISKFEVNKFQEKTEENDDETGSPINGDPAETPAVLDDVEAVESRD